MTIIKQERTTVHDDEPNLQSAPPISSGDEREAKTERLLVREQALAAIVVTTAATGDDRTTPIEIAELATDIMLMLAAGAPEFFMEWVFLWREVHDASNCEVSTHEHAVDLVAAFAELTESPEKVEQYAHVALQRLLMKSLGNLLHDDAATREL